MSEVLAERGIFILPDVIEHETYAELAEFLFTHDAAVTLYCGGDGGSIRDGLAMVDLIRAHGQVIGMLAGTAASCHGVVWASCAQRYVFPNGMLGVHKVGYKELGRGIDTTTAAMLSREMTQYERTIAMVFAEASEHDEDWWYKTLQDAGSQEYRIFTASVLQALGMARPAAMRVGIKAIAKPSVEIMMKS